MIDMFGLEVTEEGKWKGGYADCPGTGPKGETCGSWIIAMCERCNDLEAEYDCLLCGQSLCERCYGHPANEICGDCLEKENKESGK